MQVAVVVVGAMLKKLIAWAASTLVAIIVAAPSIAASVKRKVMAAVSTAQVVNTTNRWAEVGTIASAVDIVGAGIIVLVASIVGRAAVGIAETSFAVGVIPVVGVNRRFRLLQDAR